MSRCTHNARVNIMGECEVCLELIKVSDLKKELQKANDKILEASKASTILMGSEYALDPKAIIEKLQDMYRDLQDSYMEKIKENKELQKAKEEIKELKSHPEKVVADFRNKLGGVPTVLGMIEDMKIESPRCNEIFQLAVKTANEGIEKIKSDSYLKDLLTPKGNGQHFQNRDYIEKLSVDLLKIKGIKVEQSNTTPKG